MCTDVCVGSYIDMKDLFAILDLIASHNNVIACGDVIQNFKVIRVRWGEDGGGRAMWW